jgi:hypothetical protein
MQAGRMYPDQHLVGLRDRLVDVPEVQDIHVAVPVLNDCLHTLDLGQLGVAWAGVVGRGDGLGHGKSPSVASPNVAILGGRVVQWTRS